MLTFLKCCATLCLAAGVSSASPVLYTFTATTRATLNSPAHLEMFRLQLPDFMPVVEGGPLVSFFRTSPEVLACVACQTTSIPVLHFLRGATSDLVQFADDDGTTRLFTFSFGALSDFGTHSTLAGINVERGTLVVAPVPEPSTLALFLLGISALAGSLYARRADRDGRSRT